MIAEFPCFYLARFTLEGNTAFAINSGLSDQAFDSLLVRDANGLPTIPGTALAGVLRHQLSSQSDKQTERRVFGFADEQDHSQASRVQISWGCIHNSNNQPVEGLLNRLDDVLLDRLAQDHPCHRERVAINHRGVANKGSKFDVTVVPKGCRFSFELSFWSNQTDDPDWNVLIKLLHQPLRVGASTRSGLGSFKLTSLYTDVFNFKAKTNSHDSAEKTDYQRYCELETSLAATSHLQKIPEELENNQSATVRLQLKAEDFWRFGQPGTPLKNSAKTPDAVPMVEPVIHWDEHQSASIVQNLVVVPGSSVKGALAHRVQFHYNCLLMAASDKPEAIHQQLLEAEHSNFPFQNRLFGYVADNDEQHQSPGQAGLLFCDDITCAINPQQDVAHLSHNSIDRFTGGTRNAVLYMEELIWKQSFELTLEIDAWRAQNVFEKYPQQLSDYKKALKSTLDDLLAGKLALGAGSSKGHGYFIGNPDKDMHWSDSGSKWIGDQL